MVICYNRLNMLIHSPNVFISCCFFNLLFIHLFRKQTGNMSVQLLSHVQFFAIHGLQQARPPCTLSTPRACTNSHPKSRWCHPTSSSSVVPFSSCLQSFLTSGSFQMTQFFISGGQSIGVSVSASVLPMNIQDQFPLGLTGWISRDSQESSPTPQFKSINSSVFSFLYGPTLTSIHDYWKNHSFD